MITLAFWKDAAERAVKTFAQVLLLLLGSGTSALNLLDVNWQSALATAAGAAVLSLLTSMASSTVGSSTSASLLAVTAGGRHEKE